MSEPLTAIIIAKNAEATITACVRALGFCDRIIVGENDSHDQTPFLAREAGASVKTVKWEGYGLTKNRLIDDISEGWVLSIDTDEIVTPSLREEIINTINSTTTSGYALRRRNYFLNREIKGCGWGSDWQVRLFRAGQGRFQEKEVHEALKVSGKIGRLHQPLDHYSYPSLNTYLDRLNHYTSLAAQDRQRQGRQPSRLRLLVDPGWTWFKMYLLKNGWRDGFPGLVLCLLSAFNTLVKHAKHWELSKLKK